MSALTYDLDHVQQYSKFAANDSVRASVIKPFCAPVDALPEAYWTSRGDELLNLFAGNEHTPTSGSFGTLLL